MGRCRIPSSRLLYEYDLSKCTSSIELVGKKKMLRNKKCSSKESRTQTTTSNNKNLPTIAPPTNHTTSLYTEWGKEIPCQHNSAIIHSHYAYGRITYSSSCQLQVSCQPTIAHKYPQNSNFLRPPGDDVFIHCSLLVLSLKTETPRQRHAKKAAQNNPEAQSSP